jgi:hypothetical protein
MITTGTKHALACGIMTMAWHEWNYCAIANHTWPNWKTHWTSAFAEMRDINHMTVGKAAFHANTAEEEHQACKITTSLGNLANMLIQKNATIDNLVASNTQLTQALQEMQAACTCFLPAKHWHPPTSPRRGCPLHRRRRHHPLLHRPHHRQQWAHVQPTGAQSIPPGTSRATAGPTDIRSRSDTQSGPAPPGAQATRPEPPEPTQWVELSTMQGTLSATSRHLRPQPDNSKQRIMLPLM